MLLLVNQLKDGFSVLKMDKLKIAHIAGSPDSKKWGFVILAVPPIANIFLASMIFPSGLGGIFQSIGFWSMIIPTLALVGAIFGMSMIAQKFFNRTGTTASHWPLFKVLSYAGVIFWLMPLPLLLDIIGLMDYEGLLNLILMVGMIWVFVVAYNFFIHQGHMTQKDSSLTVIGGIFIYLMLQLLLGKVLIGKYYKIF